MDEKYFILIFLMYKKWQILFACSLLIHTNRIVNDKNYIFLYVQNKVSKISKSLFDIIFIIEDHLSNFMEY